MTVSRVGRPRNEAARRAVLSATRAVVLERGLSAVTMVQIADAAGVGRPTVYRWWGTKEALVAEAVLSEALPLEPVLADSSGDLLADLRSWMQKSVVRIANDDSAALYRALLAAAVLDDEALRRMTEAFAVPLRSAVRSAFESAGRAAEAEVAADILLGVMLNALMSLDPAATGRLDAIVDVVVGAPRSVVAADSESPRV